MLITMPADAKYILDTLHQAGYEAYIVGGCVRDALLHRNPDDWDITTNAKPKQVKTLFHRTIDTGIQHGTVTVMMDKTGYEVTTYRIDGLYENHRSPNSVSFTSELKEDMLRRDFTINAMAYNEEEGLVDHFHGQEDLKSHIIRCVGNPLERFDEDALRVLRALRFAAQLDFQIEQATADAMKANAGYLNEVSAERIRVELTKLLLSDHPELLMTLGEPLGVTNVVLPEFSKMLTITQENPYHCYNVGEHCMVATQHIEKTIPLRFAALLHDIGKIQTKTMDDQGIAHFYKHAIEGTSMAVNVLKRLKFDNATIRIVKELIYWHDYNWGDTFTLKKVRRAMNKVGPDCMEDLLKLQYADVAAKNPKYQQMQLDGLEEISKLYRTICEEKQCVTLKELALNGRDLMELGIQPGKQIGEILNTLLDVVIDQPEQNNKENLIAILKMKKMI